MSGHAGLLSALHPGLAGVLVLLASGAFAPEPAAQTPGATSETGSAAAPSPPAARDAETAPAAGMSLRDPAAAGRLDEARTRGFLTLPDCFEIAVAVNERIGRAEEDLNQARLVKMAARGAVLPQVTLEDNYYRQNPVTLSSTGGTASAFSFADSRNQAFLHLKQTLFAGLRDRNFWEYSKANIEAFTHRRDDARRLLYASVAQAFYSVLQAEGEVSTLEDTVKLERERVREIQARNEAGLARKTEVLLVESQLARDESSLTGAGNDLQVARARLTFLLTVPADLPLKEEPSPGVSPSGSATAAGSDGGVEAMLQIARAHRSDLKELEKTVEGAQYQVSVARGAYFPEVSLEAYGYISHTNYSAFAEATDWSAEVDFTLPIFDGGRIRSDLLNARSRLEQAILNRDELARQVELEVRQAYLTLQSDSAELVTLQTSVASADENYRLVQEEYRGGLATNLEVFAAQNQLLSARLDLERQKYQVRLDEVALQLVQGRIPLEATAAPPETAPDTTSLGGGLAP